MLTMLANTNMVNNIRFKVLRDFSDGYTVGAAV